MWLKTGWNKNQLCHLKNKFDFKLYENRKLLFKLQQYFKIFQFYCIFDWLNAVLVNIKDFF